MGAQSLLWFAVAAGAALLGLTLLVSRYARRDSPAARSDGGAILFALFMLVFAAGAAAAGYAAARAGR